MINKNISVLVLSLLFFGINASNITEDMDYYEMLGVSKTASAAEITKAYRKLALKLHPDKGGDPAEFKLINEAHQTLSDAGKRREYDSPSQSSVPFGPFDNPFESFFNYQPGERVRQQREFEERQREREREYEKNESDEELLKNPDNKLFHEMNPSLYEQFKKSRELLIKLKQEESDHKEIFGHNGIFARYDCPDCNRYRNYRLNRCFYGSYYINGTKVSRVYANSDGTVIAKLDESKPYNEFSASVIKDIKERALPFQIVWYLYDVFDSIIESKKIGVLGSENKDDKRRYM